MSACPYVEIDIVGTKGDVGGAQAPVFRATTPSAWVIASSLVGYTGADAAGERPSTGFAAAFAKCDHAREFILVVRRKAKQAVFLVARDLVMLDPCAETGSVRTHVNS